MMKRLMDFLLFSTGITPKDHKEPDKWAKFRAEREQWERAQRAKEDAQRSAGSGDSPGDTAPPSPPPTTESRTD